MASTPSRSLPLMQAPPSAREPETVSLSLEIGEELLFVPVGDELPLSHSLLVGEAQVPGSAARIVRRSKEYWLEPGQPSVSTQINEQPLSEPWRLSDGDIIQLGTMRMTFLVPRY